MSELADSLEALFARLGIDCVVDVGAHLGQFGQLVRGFYDGPIVSFEPVLPVFAALTKAHTSADERWTAHRLALGAEDGAAEINVPEATDFASFLVPNEYSLAEFGGHTAVQRRERVAVRRLDSVADEYLPRGAARLFLKVDAQGYEPEVLEGAAAILDRVVALQVEVSYRPVYEDSPRTEDVTAWLEAHGFDVTGFVPVTLDSTGEIVAADCLAVRRGL